MAQNFKGPITQVGEEVYSPSNKPTAEDLDVIGRDEVDATLNDESENPIQNKAVTEALTDIPKSFIVDTLEEVVSAPVGSYVLLEQ